MKSSTEVGKGPGDNNPGHRVENAVRDVRRIRLKNVVDEGHGVGGKASCKCWLPPVKVVLERILKVIEGETSAQSGPAQQQA